MKRNYLALLGALPLRTIVHRGSQAAMDPLVSLADRRRDLANSTYSADSPTGPLKPLLHAFPFAVLQANRSWIEETADLYSRHYFDLLGSGWVRVGHGMECAGTEGTRFAPAPAITPDGDGRWLEGRINASNLDIGRTIWRLVDPDYVPIDWQLDFKSGFRWSESTWSKDIVFGRLPHVDVKVPWELARLQHLATLALAHALASDDAPGNASTVRWREYRNQVLDFVATNPPRFGANWRCTMDVAIRGANLALSYSLFKAAEAPSDPHFDLILTRTLYDHARHVLHNLEWDPEGRGNHYFANVVGLAFIAAALPASGMTNAWLTFALQELLAETSHQFNDDGTYFEGSTAYHRLAGEMVVFGSALAIGLGDGLSEACRAADWSLLRTRPPRSVSSHGRRFDRAHIDRIAAMAEFTQTITKPSGRIPQIGDNDSGRLFKLHPAFVSRSLTEARSRYANLAAYSNGPELETFFDDDALDHRAFLAAAATLVERRDLRDRAGGSWLDADLVVALLRGRRPEELPRHPSRESRERDERQLAAKAKGAADQTIVITVSGTSLRQGLRLSSWPDFGLWLYRSDRLYLAIRCGRSGRNLTNHAHNDQLSFELMIDGIDWIADPGSFLYTPPRPLRDRWRSVTAHAAPRQGQREPASLSIGNFCLPRQGDGRCLRFSEDEFIGEHDGFGRTIRREVDIADHEITIRDFGVTPDPLRPIVRCETPVELRAALALPELMSPGYGKLLATGVQ